MEEIFESACTVKEDNDLFLARYAFENIVKEAFNEFFKESNYNIKDNYRGYYYDSFTKNIQLEDDINVFYVELKSDIIKENNNKNIIFTPNYTLDMIKNEIFNILVSVSNTDTLLCKTKHGINISYFEQNQEDIIFNKDEDKTANNNVNIQEQSETKPQKIILIDFKLIIGESYKSKNNYGIMYYAKSGGAIKVKYPLIALENYMYKNHITKNNFMYYANLIKSIMQTNSKKKYINRTEIIESMLYNLPNTFFKQKPTVDGLRNIINFMKNYPLQDYKTIDDREKLFLSENYDYSILEGKEIIKTLEKYYKTLHSTSNKE